MEEAPVTRPSLLLRIRDPQDQEAWREFFRLYGPLVYGFARKRGLQDADAADLMQEVLRSVAGAASRLEYDRQKGMFRGWLYTVTRNKIYTFLHVQNRQVRGSGDAAANERLEQQAAPEDGAASAWDHEYERRLLSYAAEQIRHEFRENTWRAFWLAAVDGKDVKEIGRQLEMSPGAIHVAKSRVLARLKDKIQELQAE